MPRGGKRQGAGRPKGSSAPRKRKHINVRMLVDLVERVKEQAKASGLSQSKTIELALMGYYGW